MTFDELTPYHGKSVKLKAVSGEDYIEVAVLDDEERDLTLYNNDYILGLKPERILSIEAVDEA